MLGAVGVAAGALITVGAAVGSTGAACAVPPWNFIIKGTISNATMLMILIIGLTAGPAVSLYGSPTVSPVTAALCASEPLPPKLPSSMYFLALSHAPPPVVMEIATKMPVTMVPTSTPPSACAPSVSPTITGTATGSSDGTIISLIAALVSMSTQVRGHADQG